MTNHVTRLFLKCVCAKRMDVEQTADRRTVWWSTQIRVFLNEHRTKSDLGMAVTHTRIRRQEWMILKESH